MTLSRSSHMRSSKGARGQTSEGGAGEVPKRSGHYSDTSSGTSCRFMRFMVPFWNHLPALL